MVVVNQSSRTKVVRFQKLVSCDWSESSSVWEAHECNKLGQLRKDCSVYRKRNAEKGNKPKGELTEITAGIKGAMVERWEYVDKDIHV